MLDWLQREFISTSPPPATCAITSRGSWSPRAALPTDRTLAIEASRDQLGDWQVILLSPLGQRLHLALRLALEARLRQRLGYQPQCLHHDDGILIRLTDTDEPILDLFDGLTPENVEGLILDELADSAAVRPALPAERGAGAAAAARPGRASGRRCGCNGCAAATCCRSAAGIPISPSSPRRSANACTTISTCRACSNCWPTSATASVEVVTRRAETPSPFAAGLLFAFTAAFMYQYDGVESRTAPAPRGWIGSCSNSSSRRSGRRICSIRGRSIRWSAGCAASAMPPRTATEMAEWLRRLGDLTPAELEGPMAAFLEELEADGRARRIELPRCREPLRWVAAEEEALYRQAFGLRRRRAGAGAGGGGGDLRPLPGDARPGRAGATCWTAIPSSPNWAQRQLEEWARTGRATPVRADDAEPLQWSAPENLEQVQRGSLALLRREVVTCPPPQFADFLLRWQGVHPDDARGGGAEGLAEVLERLQGLPLPAEVWEQTVLPARVPGYQPRWLDEWIAGGAGVWVGQGERRADCWRSSAGEMLSQLPSPPGAGPAVAGRGRPARAGTAAVGAGRRS